MRLLVHAEDELSQTKDFQRIWPTCDTHKYFKFLDAVPYSEKLMGEPPDISYCTLQPSLPDAYEHTYSKNRSAGHDFVRSWCAKGVHLRGAPVDSRKELRDLVMRLTAPSEEGSEMGAEGAEGGPPLLPRC